MHTQDTSIKHPGHSCVPQPRGCTTFAMPSIPSTAYKLNIASPLHMWSRTLNTKEHELPYNTTHIKLLWKWIQTSGFLFILQVHHHLYNTSSLKSFSPFICSISAHYEIFTCTQYTNKCTVMKYTALNDLPCTTHISYLTGCVTTTCN
jgi:hypothetical protein